MGGMSTGKCGGAVVAATLSALVLVACSGQPVSTGSNPVVKRPHPAIYASVVDLRDAYLDAGGTCDEWARDYSTQDATEAGRCADGGVLMIFSDAKAASDRAVELRRLLAEAGSSAGLAAGGNWLIVSYDAPGVAAALGGAS